MPHDGTPLVGLYQALRKVCLTLRQNFQFHFLPFSFIIFFFPLYRFLDFIFRSFLCFLLKFRILACGCRECPASPVNVLNTIVRTSTRGCGSGCRPPRRQRRGNCLACPLSAQRSCFGPQPQTGTSGQLKNPLVRVR